MRARFAILIALALLGAACSSNSSNDKATPANASTTTTKPRPPGPAADLSQELTGGDGPFIGSAAPVDFAGAGYVEHEYVASGTATSYKAEGALAKNGRWSFVPGGTAPYHTRVVVRRPADAAKFSGTVVVEWLNVSAGLDSAPDFDSTREELLRAGDAWVGVSAQRIGVEGGPVLVAVPTPEAESFAGKGLKKIDPARYGSLAHPGDGYSFDIFTQVTRAIRAGGPALGDLQPRSVIAAGESQSAFALVTYVNGVQPLTHAFDGFFVHSRGAAGLPLVGPGQSADIAGSLGGAEAIFRTDTDVPILDLQTESDVTSILDSAQARQPDTDRFRLWEVAGTAHADAHIIGSTADSLDCGVAINNGAAHIVAKAALHSLDEWVRTGALPPHAPRIELTSGAQPAVRRDPDGIALGGIRTPPVDVPVDVLSSVEGPTGGVICLLLGSTTPLPAARLTALYPSRADYEQRYDADVDTTIKAGFALEADRAALVAFADPSRIPG